MTTFSPVCQLEAALAEDKARARIRALERRKSCDPALGGQLALRLLAEMPPPPGAAVAGFWPMSGEIDIRPLLIALHERGNSVLLPETPKRGQPLVFRRWTPETPMRRGRFGTQEPDGGEIATPDWLLVPLLAFDRRGHRLGYGAGYYDRTLAELSGRTAVGCAYAGLEVDAVPAGDYDARLDAVATEAGVIVCTKD